VLDLFVTILGQPGDDNEKAWLALVNACSDGSPLPAAVIQALSMPVGNQQGILVDNTVSLKSYDGSNVLGLLIQRSLGEPWTPKLEWREQPRGTKWRLFDAAPGGDVTIDLHEVAAR
jgi:hypothetical protein